MIARVQDTTQGFVIVIPQEYVEAWGLRQDSAVEVHRVGSTHEADEPTVIREAHEQFMAARDYMLQKHDAVFRELAKGPEGLGPHEPGFVWPRRISD